MGLLIEIGSKTGGRERDQRAGLENTVLLSLCRFLSLSQLLQHPWSTIKARTVSNLGAFLPRPSMPLPLRGEFPSLSSSLSSREPVFECFDRLCHHGCDFLHWWSPGVIARGGAAWGWTRMGTASAGPIIGLLLIHLGVTPTGCEKDGFYLDLLEYSSSSSSKFFLSSPHIPRGLCC